MRSAGIRSALMIALSTCVVFGLLALPARAQTAADPHETSVRVGILAHRGWPGIERYWKPLEIYLSKSLGSPVVLVPVTLASTGPLIDKGALEFLITNPGHYVTLEKTFPMSVIATLRRRLSDGSLRSEFGSAILTRATSGIQTLQDAQGKRVTAVDPNAFGGFQVAWLEFTSRGIDPFTDFSDLSFVGFPQDQIIANILQGKTDIGIVRSGLIETLTTEGTLDPSAIRVLNNNVSFTHPDALSTRLYPEWPFLAMANTPDGLRDRIALALLQTQDPGVQAAQALRDKWAAPLSYHSVRVLDAAYIARTTPAPVGQEQRSLPWLALLGAALAGLVAFLLIRTRSRKPTPRPIPPADQTIDPTGPQVSLTQREAEILELVAKGQSSKAIAKQLGISPKTVEFHRSNLLRKYDVKTTVELARITALLPKNAQT